MNSGKLPPLNAAIRFRPFLRPMVWGSRRLAERLGKELPGASAYGESWEVSDHEVHHSIVANGAWAGSTMRTLMDEQREALLGRAAAQHAVFPWLIKFLDADDWLSVQVHPDERTVARLGLLDGSKSEAWFVLDAAPGSRIYAGLRRGIDEPALRATVARGTVLDCLHSFTPTAGDCLFLPAGTVHAVGGGVLLAEIQQTSDITFRLFDWNRSEPGGKRPLQIDEAIAGIDWGQAPVNPVRATRASGSRSSVPAPQSLVRCPYFELDYVQSDHVTDFGATGRLQAIIVLAGSGELPESRENLLPGQVWLLPAVMPAVSCRPDPSLEYLLCTLP